MAVPAGEEVATLEPLAVLRQQASRLAAAARAPSTVRGYTSDMADFAAWCAQHSLVAIPATPESVAFYLTALAGHGAAVGTLSRRLSSIRHHHQAAQLLDPTSDPAVRYVLDGIRRTLSRPEQGAAPLLPPHLFDVLDACPNTFHTQRDPTPRPSLAGARDRALLMVGFVGALRRSELAAIDLEHLEPDPRGLLLHIPRSKTSPDRTTDELVVLPRAHTEAHCPVTLLERWCDLAGITEGPVFRAVTKGNRLHPAGARLSEDAVNQLVKAAVRRANLPSPERYSAHSLRVGFVTYADQRGASPQEIARQTRHRALSTVARYTRHEEAWRRNAATQLGL